MKKISMLGSVVIVAIFALTASPVFASTTNVTDQASFEAAITATVAGDTIVLDNNFTVGNKVDVNKAITIDGNGFTISPTFAKTDNSNNATLGIFGNGVTVKDLTVDGTGGTNLHGINIFVATNVLLNNVTVINNDRTGIVVNGSTVTVNNITTANNGWGGINVDLGGGVTTPAALTVNGISHHSDVAHIYVDDTTKEVSVVDTNSQYNSVHVGQKKNDLLYTLIPFVRSAKITSPTNGEVVSGRLVSFDATLDDEDGNDNVSWAVREGTCAAGVGTVFGNVDTYNDPFDWDNYNFHASADTTTWTPGDYCFIFNPTESSGDTAIRETVEFVVADTLAPVITLVEPMDGETYSVIPFKATCNEECDYVNFWWTKVGEPFASADKQYHYVRDNGILFEWELNTLAPEYWQNNVRGPMDDGDYFVYGAGKDVAGNWARTVRVMIHINNTPDVKNDCKKDGWKTWTNPEFKNQGACVSYLESNDKAGKRN